MQIRIVVLVASVRTMGVGSVADEDDVDNNADDIALQQAPAQFPAGRVNSGRKRSSRGRYLLTCLLINKASVQARRPVARQPVMTDNFRADIESRDWVT